MMRVTWQESRLMSPPQFADFKVPFRPENHPEQHVLHGQQQQFTIAKEAPIIQQARGSAPFAALL